MNYIKNRIRQHSTWLGLLSVAATLIASNGAVNMETLSALAAAFGLVHIDEGK